MSAHRDHQTGSSGAERGPALAEQVPSPWLTLAEAAAHLKVSQSWLERSDCPRTIVGRMRRFYRPDIDRWRIGHLSHRPSDAA